MIVKPEALMVEAALIDCLDELTNKVAGHGIDRCRQSMAENEIRDSTRAWWRLSQAEVEKRVIEYAVTVHDGVTRSIMRIGDWTRREDGRRAFVALTVDNPAMVEQWVGDLGRRVEFTAAAQNPISYWPRCAADPNHS